MARKARTPRRHRMSVTIPAGEFKAQCLRLMDEVAEKQTEIVITKYGRPIAKLVPATDGVSDSFGAMRGSVIYADQDIVSPDHEAWSGGESS